MLETVLHGDPVKFNVNLVLIDFSLRHGLLDALSPAQKARLVAGFDQVG